MSLLQAEHQSDNEELGMVKQRILKTKFPYPKIGRGKYKNQLLTLNNLLKCHWSLISKIKSDLKTVLREWFFAENPDEPYSYLVISFRILSKDKRNHDAINVAYIAKIAEDVLVDLGWVKDDNQNKIILEPSRYEEGLSETMIEVIVEGVRNGR